MTKPMFDENFRYNAEATALDQGAYKAIKGLMDKYIADGHNPRDVYYVVQQSAHDVALDALLDMRPLVNNEG